jgi:hypothetical protein
MTSCFFFKQVDTGMQQHWQWPSTFKLMSEKISRVGILVISASLLERVLTAAVTVCSVVHGHHMIPDRLNLADSSESHRGRSSMTRLRYPVDHQEQVLFRRCAPSYAHWGSSIHPTTRRVPTVIIFVWDPLPDGFLSLVLVVVIADS